MVETGFQCGVVGTVCLWVVRTVYLWGGGNCLSVGWLELFVCGVVATVCL